MRDQYIKHKGKCRKGEGKYNNTCINRAGHVLISFPEGEELEMHGKYSNDIIEGAVNAISTIQKGRGTQ